MVDKIRFLIMEQLPVDGRHVDKEALESNVSSDALCLNLSYSRGMFDKILMYLFEDQYVVYLGCLIIATNICFIKSNIL